MYDTPILFIVFNRLDTTKRVFESIKAQKPSKLYIAGDGARQEGEQQKVEKIRAYLLQEIDWACEVKTKFQDTNVGCGKNVSDAITWFFDNEEMGIILEDDCLPDPSFYRYCDELLKKYANDERVMNISGDNFLFKDADKCETSYYFTRYGLTWGWATWRRAWKKYDFTMTGWDSFKKYGNMEEQITRLDERLFWISIFDEMASPKHADTWDFQWHFTILKNNGICICPQKNLIQNIGFSEDATHTKQAPIEGHMQSAKELNFPLIHPPEVKVNSYLDNICCDNNLLTRKRGIRYILSWYWRAFKKRVKNKK